MLGNQYRLIATFTEVQKTQKPTLLVFCSCICSYFSASVALSHTILLRLHVPFTGGILDTNAAELTKWRAMLELSPVSLIAMCVSECVKVGVVCVCVCVCVCDRMRK